MTVQVNQHLTDSITKKEILQALLDLVQGYGIEVHYIV